MIMADKHYTAWLTLDAGALTDGYCNVSVLRDEIVGERQQGATITPVWGATTEEAFSAPTSVKPGDADDKTAMDDAEDLLTDAGWTRAGDWVAVPTGYTVTVERAEQA